MPAPKKESPKKRAANKPKNQYRMVYSKKGQNTKMEMWVDCASAEAAWDTLNKADEYSLVEITYLGAVNE